jgi:hypothetical protein
VLLDTRYASKTPLNKIQGLDWSFVARLRKNRALDAFFGRVRNYV